MHHSSATLGPDPAQTALHRNRNRNQNQHTAWNRIASQQVCFNQHARETHRRVSANYSFRPGLALASKFTCSTAYCQSLSQPLNKFITHYHFRDFSLLPLSPALHDNNHRLLVQLSTRGWHSHVNLEVWWITDTYLQFCIWHLDGILRSAVCMVPTKIRQIHPIPYCMYPCAFHLTLPSPQVLALAGWLSSGCCSARQMIIRYLSISSSWSHTSISFLCCFLTTTSFLAN